MSELIGKGYDAILIDHYNQGKEIFSDIQRDWYQDAGEEGIINSRYRNMYRDYTNLIDCADHYYNTRYVDNLRKR